MIRIRKTITVAALLLTVAACREEKPAPTETVAPAPPPAPVVTATPIQSDVPGYPTAGLQMWLRAELGTTSSPDGSLSTWRSPNNIIATQSDPARQPKFAPEQPPSVRFDGVDDVLSSNLNINPSVLPTLTVITVFRSATADSAPSRKLYSHDDGNADRGAGIDNRGGQSPFVLYGGQSGVVGYFPIAADTWYLTIDEYAINQLSAWANGRAYITARPVTHGEGLTELNIGGLTANPSESWKGDIAEMLVYNRKLTAEERVAMEDALSAKFGITLQRQ